MKFTKRLKKTLLTFNHKKARLQFVVKHITWMGKWSKVIFSDETKFNLDGPDGCQYYWHDIRSEKEVCMSRNFGGRNVWGGFCYGGIIPLFLLRTTLNSKNYLELLEFVLEEFGEKMAGQDFIFQQDNAAVHTAKIVKECLQPQKPIE